MSRFFPFLKWSIILGVGLIMGGLVIACGPTAPKPMPRPTLEQGEVAQMPPATPTLSASPAPTPALLAPDDSCVACHTNQDQLMATAKEEVVKESLSEGEG